MHLSVKSVPPKSPIFPTNLQMKAGPIFTDLSNGVAEVTDFPEKYVMKKGPVFIRNFPEKWELRGALESINVGRKSVAETGPIFITDFSVKPVPPKSPILPRNL